MKIRVLGCHGSRLPGFNTTSFLVNDRLLVDGGSITSVLTAEEQFNIDYVLVTHCHLDHICDIVFLADNIFYSKREQPLAVIGTPHVIDSLKRFIFNGEVWPDFSSLPDRERAVIKFRALEPGESISLCGMDVKAVRLNHTVESVGYILRAPEGSVIFMGDTGPTEEIWDEARALGDLRAVFVETSMPDAMQDIAEMTRHLTPSTLRGELKKLGAAVPDVFLYHLKIKHIETIRREVDSINNDRIRIIEDGQILKIGPRNDAKEHQRS